MSSKKYTYHIKKVVLALLCLTTFASCQFHELTEECDKKGLIIVNLGLEGLSTRAAGPLFTGDDQIDKIRIFVFHGNVLEVSNLYTSTDDQFNNPFVMEVTTGTKDVYVVANESNAITSALQAVTTKTELISIIEYQMNSALSLPLIMTGKKEDVEVVELIEPLHNSTYIELKRIAAKISLKFKKDTDKEVYITKVSLLNNTGKTTIWEEVTAASNQDYWNWTHAPATALELNSTAIPLVGQDNLYFFENLAGATNKDKAVELEVEALFDNIQTTYRVYVNEDIESPGSGIPGDPDSSFVSIKDHFYNIKRNYHYQLTVTITDMKKFTTISVKVKILPWDVHDYPIELK